MGTNRWSLRRHLRRGGRIADLIRYTGYVAPPAPDSLPDGPGKGEVVVAAGGAPSAARCCGLRWLRGR